MRKTIGQRTVRQETTMAKSGTLTHYLYTSSIENIVDSTEDAKLINFEENIQEHKNLQKHPTDLFLENNCSCEVSKR